MTEGLPSDSSSRPQVGEDGVRRIAELARLRVEPDEIPSLAHHFERILDFVAELRQVDVDGVEPDLLDGRALDSLRSDEIRPAGGPGGPLPHDVIEERAPEMEGPHFSTPRVV